MKGTFGENAMEIITKVRVGVYLEVLQSYQYWCTSKGKVQLVILCGASLLLE